MDKRDPVINIHESDLTALLAAEAERDALRALLAERIKIDNIAVPTEDGPMCGLCGAEWEYEDDMPDVKPGTEWHEPGCWVLRSRAALGATADQEATP